MARVALVYNLVHPEQLRRGPLDTVAEYDNEETIAALRTALEADGHTVLPVEADETIMEHLRTLRPDIVFNVAEGLRSGVGTAADVPRNRISNTPNSFVAKWNPQPHRL